ncbi:MAG: cadherin domain-containing protein [Sneathiella sp.]
MSDKSKQDILNQDLEHVASTVSKTDSPFSEKALEEKGAQTVSDHDRSLANIHTGSTQEYEENSPSSVTPAELTEQQAGQPELENETGASDTSSEDVILAEVPQEDTQTTVTEGRASSFSIESSASVVSEQFAQQTEALLQETRLEERAGEQDVKDSEGAGSTAKEENIPADNLAPESVALDDNNVDENSAIGTVVGTVSAEDPENDSLTFTLADDAGGLFTIDETTGEIKVAGALDYESIDSYSVTVDVSDGTNVTQQIFSINVADINEAPMIDGDYSTGLGPNRIINGSFEDTDNNADMAVNHGSWATFDSLPGWNVNTDQSDAPMELQYGNTGGIGAQDGNNKLEMNSHVEGGYSEADAHVYQDVQTEAGEQLTVSFWYSPRAGGGDSEVEVYWDGQLLTTLSGDQSGWQQFSFEVEAGEGNQTRLEFRGEEGGGTMGGYIDTVYVGGEAPEYNTVSEDTVIGDVIGTITGTDPENDTLTYSLSEDADGKFSIDPVTGDIKVAGELDFESAEKHWITVDVSDGEHVVQQIVAINVGDVNEAPHSVALDDASVDENSAIGTVVGTVSAEDPENDSLSYSLSDDANGLFTIDASTGEIKVAGTLDHENIDSYSVTVDVSDGTHVTQQNFRIEVGDVNEAPTLFGQGSSIDASNIEDVVDLSHMDQFPELRGGSHLENRVGTEVFDEMVEDAQHLVINYQSEATVTFKGETAGYRNSVGAYQIKEDGTIEDVQLLWGDASTDKLTTGESTATYTGIESGSELGFFIISNGFGDLPADAVSGDGNTISETGTWMFVSPGFDPTTDNPEEHLYNVNTDSGAPQMIYVEGDGTIHTESGNVFHSLRQQDFNPDSNTDNREHFVAGIDQENGILNFGIEDLMGGGDADFDDSMFSVEIDARDLIEAPNPIFAEHANGQSSFQISDVDSGELSGLVVTVSDVQTGDVITIGGAYDVAGNEIFLPDGTSTGISVSITQEGDTITVELSGDGAVADYEGIAQKLNFSNDSGLDSSGFRTVSVVATDTGGESSDTLVTSLYVDPDGGTSSDAGTTLEGTSGNDVIVGSAGDDYITGGDGSDIYYFDATSGNDTFIGGDGGGWSDTIVLTDGMPTGNVSDWLTLDSGTVEQSSDGAVFLSEDAVGTINVDGVELTFEGVEKIEG